MNRYLFFAVVACWLVVSLPFVSAVQYSLEYDANGNLVTGDGKYREYTDFNQLEKIYNGSNSSGTLLQEYVYHPIEERILVKKTYHENGSLKETVTYVSKTFVQVANESGTFNYTYVYQDGKLVAQENPDGTKFYLLGDVLGSTSVVTNQSGTVEERSKYSPYGEVLSGGESIRYGYEAKEHDTLVGDTDFNARKYKADWGIFLQPDSMLPDIYDPQQLNRYTFERNNPYKYADSTGHNPLRVVEDIKVWWAGTQWVVENADEAEHRINQGDYTDDRTLTEKAVMNTGEATGVYAATRLALFPFREGFDSASEPFRDDYHRQLATDNRYARRERVVFDGLSLLIPKVKGTLGWFGESFSDISTYYTFGTGNNIIQDVYHSGQESYIRVTVAFQGLTNHDAFRLYSAGFSGGSTGFHALKKGESYGGTTCYTENKRASTPDF